MCLQDKCLVHCLDVVDVGGVLPNMWAGWCSPTCGRGGALQLTITLLRSLYSAQDLVISTQNTQCPPPPPLSFVTIFVGFFPSVGVVAPRMFGCHFGGYGYFLGLGYFALFFLSLFYHYFIIMYTLFSHNFYIFFTFTIVRRYKKCILQFVSALQCTLAKMPIQFLIRLTFETTN